MSFAINVPSNRQYSYVSKRAGQLGNYPHYTKKWEIKLCKRHIKYEKTVFQECLSHIPPPVKMYQHSEDVENSIKQVATTLYECSKQSIVEKVQHHDANTNRWIGMDG